MFNKPRERIPHPPSHTMHVPPQQMMGVPPSMHQMGGGAPIPHQERFTRIGMSPDQQQMMGIPPEYYHLNGHQQMSGHQPTRIGTSPTVTNSPTHIHRMQGTYGQPEVPPHPYPIQASHHYPRGRRGTLPRREEETAYNSYGMIPSTQQHDVNKQSYQHIGMGQENLVPSYPQMTPVPPAIMQHQQQGSSQTPYSTPPLGPAHQSNPSIHSSPQQGGNLYGMMPSNHPYDTQPQGHASMPSAYQQPEVQPSPYQQQAYAQEGHGMMHDQQSNGKNPFHVYMPQEQSVPFFPPDGPNFQALGGMGPQFPYPVQPNQNGKKEPSQFQNMLAQFKASDGNYDINKMMNTAGTVMNTMNQLSGMVKQVGAFFSVK